MEIETKTVRNLVTALENATQMAKHLPSTTTVTDSTNIYAFLHAAHHHQPIFLSSHTPQPSSANVSVSLMQLADDDQQVIHGEAEEDSKMVTIDSVEERMKDCFINNKRLKRTLSPSSVVAGERNCIGQSSN